MKLKEIYALFVKEGIRTDLRTTQQIRESLLEKKKEFKKTSSKLRRFFDKESFTNPFADTRILFGDPNAEVKRILVGIDIEIGELLLAHQLSRSGQKIDLILAHHPEGVALAGLYDVMRLQTDVLSNLGVDETVARDCMKKRINEVSRRLHSANHSRGVDAARLLNLSFMCCHTPADNHVAGYLQKLVDRRKPKTLQHVIELLLKEPEYQDAAMNKAGPAVFLGRAKDAAGKILVDMTGGTEGSKEIYARISQLGIKTLLGMHLSEAHFEKIKPEHMHVVIAGHMASDNLGMNLLLDKLEKKGKVEIIECSGFRRVKRHGLNS